MGVELAAQRVRLSLDLGLRRGQALHEVGLERQESPPDRLAGRVGGSLGFAHRPCVPLDLVDLLLAEDHRRRLVDALQLLRRQLEDVDHLGAGLPAGGGHNRRPLRRVLSRLVGGRHVEQRLDLVGVAVGVAGHLDVQARQRRLVLTRPLGELEHRVRAGLRGDARHLEDVGQSGRLLGRGTALVLDLVDPVGQLDELLDARRDQGADRHAGADKAGREEASLPSHALDQAGDLLANGAHGPQAARQGGGRLVQLVEVLAGLVGALAVGLADDPVDEVADAHVRPAPDSAR